MSTLTIWSHTHSSVPATSVDDSIVPTTLGGEFGELTHPV